MPRRTRKQMRRRSVPDSMKPKGMKRPRGWHRGPQQDELYLAAEARLGA